MQEFDSSTTRAFRPSSTDPSTWSSLKSGGRFGIERLPKDTARNSRNSGLVAGNRQQVKLTALRSSPQKI